MSPEMIQAIAEAFGLPPDSTFEDVVAAVSGWLKQVQDAANGNAPPPVTDEGGDAPDAPADPAAMNIVKRLGQVYALALHKRGSDKELTALRSNLLRETDRATTTEAFTVIATWKSSHLSLADEKRKLEAERGTLEASDRLTLAKEAVLHGESPAVAYGKDKDGVTDATKPSALFMRMTMPELREHVTAKKSSFKAGGGGNGTPEPPKTPPAAGDISVSVDGKAVMLNAHDQKFCKDHNITHEARARAKLRLAR